MITEGRRLRLDALNRAFEKAFSHTASRETLLDLLGCMGEELGCDRISIFELNMDNTCDNTYEWCSPGKTHVRELMQSIPLTLFDDWMDLMLGNEYICIRDLESVRVNEPDVYALLHAQQVNAVIASRLAFHGRNIGFFILENPDEEVLGDAETVIPGMRYILSSLVYSDHLLRKLERNNYLDHLTNTGNRTGLQQAFNELNPGQPLGLIFCEVLGWKQGDHRLTEIQEEQALIRMGEILSGLFDEAHMFRIAPDEFLALMPDTDRESMEFQVHTLRHLLDEHDVLAALGWIYAEQAGCEHDLLVRQAHLMAHNEIRAMTKGKKQEEHAEEGENLAHIPLYRADEFFRQAPKHFSDFYDEELLTVVVDINYFKLYNDIFGRKAGDFLLEETADNLRRFAEERMGIAGYLGGDNFIAVLPTRETNEEKLGRLLEEMARKLHCPDGFPPVLGAYLSRDRQETLVAMYDHALTALQDIKGSYVECYRFYDAEHYRRERESKVLMLEAKKGIADGEFMFYLQPQVDEKDGKIVGAEALSRWMHKGQLVSPAQYIPVLEKSGYIFAMDCYIWESVCRWLKSLKDRGIRPLPVSVNVSRVDFYFEDIAEHIIDLTRKYEIEPSLLGIEITESAFTDNTDIIVEAVRKLHEAGFKVLMDDFGSGSSSLSMLHTVHLDVLKTDIRFMSSDLSNSRSYSIVGSVVSMAHMIGMIVVTEGVETEQQRQNLVAMGGNFAQGYYFYRPIPVEEFEQLLQDPSKIGDAFIHGMHVGENHLKFRDMIGRGMLSETLLDNIIGASAVYRLEEGKLSLVQFNEQYRTLSGVDLAGPPSAKADRILGENTDMLLQLFSLANRNPFEGVTGSIRVPWNDGQRRMSIRVFLLYTGENYRLYFLSAQDEVNTEPLTLNQGADN